MASATIDVIDAHNATIALEKPIIPGRAAAADSRPIVLSNEDLAALAPSQYEAVAASATNQALGASGATGDMLLGVVLIPASTSPGAVTIKDSSGGSSITIFAGGATSVSNLVPFYVPLGIKSVAGAWFITTGASISALAVGKFT